MIIFFAMMGALLVLMLMGSPVAVSMGLTSVFTLGVLRGFDAIPWDMLSQRILYGVTNFTLLAIPFFLLAGRLSNEVQVTDRIFDFAKSLVGHFKGGLGHVNVLASMIFAGMSGSAVAEAGGLGRIEIKAMVDDGYDLEFSTALTATSATIGPIIPPSIPMVIYGAVAGESVAKLLIAGFVPGVIMGITMMTMLVIMAPWKGFKAKPRASFHEMRGALKRGILPLSRSRHPHRWHRRGDLYAHRGRGRRGGLRRSHGGHLPNADLAGLHRRTPRVDAGHRDHPLYRGRQLHL